MADRLRNAEANVRGGRAPRRRDGGVEFDKAASSERVQPELGGRDGVGAVDTPRKQWLFVNIKPLKLKATWSEEASAFVDQWYRLNEWKK